MAKKSQRRNQAKGAPQVIPMRANPNWLLLGLALIGMGLTSYLTASTWLAKDVVGCTAGSDCDVVLGSRWATLFDVPTSLWGFLAYSTLAAISFIKRSDLHAKLAWSVAIFGVLYSLYLTYISFTQLEAACHYCLTSLSLLLAILGTVSYQWPRNLPHFSWPRWSLYTVPSGLILVAALHLHYAGADVKTADVPEDTKLRALADYLSKEDAKFYGAYWCPACQAQKALFGTSTHRLPYVECSPNGRNAQPATICTVMSIRSYPTWIIKGRPHTGMLSLKELARLTGYTDEL